MSALAPRFAEIERRLSAMERAPLTLDIPFKFSAARDMDTVTRRAVATSSSAWDTLWEMGWPNPPLYPGLSLTLHAETSAGTSWELRFMVENGIDPARVAVFPIGTFSVFHHMLRWSFSPGSAFLTRGSLRATIAGRVTSGTGGAVRAFHPLSPSLRTHLSINTAGGFSTEGTLSAPRTPPPS